MEFRTIDHFGIRVSKCGIVINNKTGKTLKPSLDRFGYQRIHIRGKDGNRRGVFVHRLIAIAWIDNPEGKIWVNHKDGNKSNCHFDNLEWCTPQENTDHAWANGLMKNNIKARERLTKKTRNKAMLDLKNLGYTNYEIAEVFGCSQPNVSRILNSKAMQF